MKRPGFALPVIVLAIAIGGLALAITRPRDVDTSSQPSLSPATPAPAIGSRLPGPGTILRADTFSEPFTFTLPTFPSDAATPVIGEGTKNSYRVASSLWGAVTFHDDGTLPADMCRPSGSSITDIPSTPVAVGRWLESGAGFSVSAPITMAVDGRPAMIWDTVTGDACDTDASRPAPWFAAGERHRIYAVPTGSDTILVITWGVDWSNGTDEYLDQVNAASDELVRSMKFSGGDGS
jgi:hypothetical protein